MHQNIIRLPTKKSPTFIILDISSGPVPATVKDRITIPLLFSVPVEKSIPVSL